MKQSGAIKSRQLSQDHQRADQVPWLQALEPVSTIPSGQIAWLPQHDSFFGMLTVRETCEMAAFLELPHWPASQRHDLVTSHLDALGLKSVQHRRVGAMAGSAGLSGGEKRRLSVALELITTPRLLLADEPSTGLDAFQALKVMKLLKRLARERNIPVISSIHQPPAALWKLLDDVLLMAPGGRVCYMGPRQNATQYFATLGYPCPLETNPAEHLIDLVSIDTEDPEQAGIDEERIATLFRAFCSYKQEHNAPSSLTQLTAATGQDAIQNTENRLRSSPSRRKYDRPTPLRSFKFLVQRTAALWLRAWRQNVRNNRVNILRLAASAGNALLFSQIFDTLRQKGKPTSKSVADRTALLSYGVINMTMMALMKTIDLFSKEKVVVQREKHLRRQYNSLEYLLSKVVAELPLDTCFAAVFTTIIKWTTNLRISWKELTGTFSLMTVTGATLGFAIGSLTSSQEAAMSVGVPLLVVLMVVGIINPSGMESTKPQPAVVRALKFFSPIAPAIQAVCVAEYDGMEFDKSRGGWRRTLAELPKMGALAMVQNGKQVLEALGLDKISYGGAMKHMLGLSLLNFLISWIGLEVVGGSSSSFVQATLQQKGKKKRRLSFQRGGGRETDGGTTGNDSSQQTLFVPLLRKV